MAELRRTSELRQVELTDAALRIIANQGITALTTRTLAAEVGLSSGAIFRHFASLDALLEAVVTRVEAVLESTYPPPSLPPLERLSQFIEARSTTIGDQLGILRLVLSDQFVLALPKGGSARLAACVQRSRQFIVECLREGQADNVVRGDVAAEALAPIVMGTMQVLALNRSRQQPAESRAVRATLLSVLAAPGEAPATKKKRSR